MWLFSYTLASKHKGAQPYQGQFVVQGCPAYCVTLHLTMSIINFIPIYIALGWCFYSFLNEGCNMCKSQTPIHVKARLIFLKQHIQSLQKYNSCFNLFNLYELNKNETAKKKSKDAIKPKKMPFLIYCYMFVSPDGTKMWRRLIPKGLKIQCRHLKFKSINPCIDTCGKPVPRQTLFIVSQSRQSVQWKRIPRNRAFFW